MFNYIADDLGLPNIAPKKDEDKVLWLDHVLFVLSPMLKDKMHYVSKATQMGLAKAGKTDWEQEAMWLVKAIDEVDAKIAELGINAKVVSVEIHQGDSTGYMEVHAKFDNGTEKIVATYFADELSFTPDEFIGLTSRQASDLHTRKDQSYLRS